jgi:hypothetical protein
MVDFTHLFCDSGMKPYPIRYSELVQERLVSV